MTKKKDKTETYAKIIMITLMLFFVAMLFLLSTACKDPLTYNMGLTCQHTRTISVNPPRTGYPKTESSIEILLDIDYDEFMQYLKDSSYQKVICKETETVTITKTITCYQ